MKIEKITTGFLAGNLFADETGIDVDASVSAYDAAIENALREAFPGVEIEVRHQNASGVTPCGLKTAVYFDTENDADDYDAEQERHIIDCVSRVVGDVWERGEWIVEVANAA